MTFAPIPNWLMRRRDLSPGAKLCYARLTQFAGKDGQCFPSLSVLAEELGCSRSQVKRYIKELERANLVERLQRDGHSNFFSFPSEALIEAITAEGWNKARAGEATNEPSPGSFANQGEVISDPEGGHIWPGGRSDVTPVKENLKENLRENLKEKENKASSFERENNSFSLKGGYPLKPPLGENMAMISKGAEIMGQESNNLSSCFRKWFLARFGRNPADGQEFYIPHSQWEQYPQFEQNLFDKFCEAGLVERKGYYKGADGLVRRFVVHLAQESTKNDFMKLCRIYEDNIGPLTPALTTKLSDLAQEYPADWFKEAVAEACAQNKRSLAYIQRILDRWKVEGFKSERRANGKAGQRTGRRNPKLVSGPNEGLLTDEEIERLRKEMPWAISE